MIPNKAYCINLSDRKDRWDQFVTQRLPFPVERHEAVKDSIGWYGCRVSYLEVLAKVEGITLIMEDDCMFLFDWDYISKITEQLPADWDLLYFGATLNEPLKKYSENLYRITKGWTTHAILYNGDKVPKYVIKETPHIRKIDVFLANEVQTRFNCFITCPLTATQRPSFSNVINRDQDYKVIKERYAKYVQ